MLWTMLRWNVGNTLPIAAFCLLSMLGAVNSGLTASGSDNERLAEVGACSGLCSSTPTTSASAQRHPVASCTIALIVPEEFAVD
jgi:hypothetical protein